MDDRAFGALLLAREIVPSTGCTEPAAIALVAAAAAARARAPASILPASELRALRVEVDPGTLKNSLSVGLPGTAEKGPAVAAAAGLLVARPEVGLDVLGRARPATWAMARDLVDRGRVVVAPLEGTGGVRLVARLETTAGRTVHAEIRDRHDGLVGDRSPNDSDAPAIPDAEIRERLASAGDLLRIAAALEDEDLEPVRRAVEVNDALARASIEQRLGLGLGRRMSDGLPETGDLARRVAARVAAAVEARMAGAPFAVLTSGGSGNSGLTVSLGLAEAADVLGIESRHRRDRAAALGHLANVAIKVRLGRVGPLCGGVTASAVSVGAGVVGLLGGDADALDRYFRLALGATTGALCDGAKPACAAKIAGGLSAALGAARLATEGHEPGDAGLGGASTAEAFANLEALVRGPLAQADDALIRILHGD